MVKNSPANTGDIETWVPSLGREDPLEEGVATYSSILAWRIPWTEELGGLQSMGSRRVGHTEQLSTSSVRRLKTYVSMYMRADEPGRGGTKLVNSLVRSLAFFI